MAVAGGAMLTRRLGLGDAVVIGAGSMIGAGVVLAVALPTSAVVGAVIVLGAGVAIRTISIAVTGVAPTRG